MTEADDAICLQVNTCAGSIVHQPPDPHRVTSPTSLLEDRTAPSHQRVCIPRNYRCQTKYATGRARTAGRNNHTAATCKAAVTGATVPVAVSKPHIGTRDAAAGKVNGSMLPTSAPLSGVSSMPVFLNPVNHSAQLACRYRECRCGWRLGVADIHGLRIVQLICKPLGSGWKSLARASAWMQVVDRPVSFIPCRAWSGGWVM